MKKPLLALAGLSAFATTAAAQTNVAIYGVFDIGLSAVKSNTASTRISEDSGIQQGSRLGFKGTDDLDGGLAAEFRLENGFNGNTGGAAQGGRIFGRQSWVGLNGAFGSIKFGRQWMPSYVVVNDLDPFGVALAGDASVYFGSNIYNHIDIRVSNAINYSFSADELSAVFTVGLGDVVNNFSSKHQLGFSIAYEHEPLNIELGYHNVKDGTGDGTARSIILGGIFNLGPAKAHIAFGIDRTDSAGLRTYDRRNMLVGTVIQKATGAILVSWIRQNDLLSTNKHTSQYALGYTHTLSKRTNLYTSFGHADADKLTTLDLGIRHLF